MIHIGNKIQEVLKAQRMPVSEFAKKINKSRTVIYHLFERDSIDSHLLNKISEVLEYNFFSFYTKEGNISTVNESLQIHGDGYKQKYFELLEKYNLLLENKVEDYFKSKL